MAWRPFAFVLFASATTIPAAGYSQTPWFDAGQQAMIIHNGQLLEQQTAPDQRDDSDNARPEKRSSSADPACDVEAIKARLRPQYERRVKAEGQEAAQSWLSRVAADLGRRAAQAGC